MESILTQCPRCQTSFKVSAKQLAIAEGMVRCGSCLDVFSAPANRITIRQPVSADALKDDHTDEDESVEFTLHDDNAPPGGTENIAGNPAVTAESSAFDLNYTATLKYDVGQLIDADAVTPVNVASGVHASAYAIDNSGFVFDDDIPLGDMVLDEVDFDKHEAAGFEDEASDEPDTTEEFEGEDYSDADRLEEEYEQTAEENSASSYAETHGEITSSSNVANTLVNPAVAIGYGNELVADEDRGNIFAEELPEADETLVFELDPEFTSETVPVHEFEKHAIPDEGINPAITSTRDISPPTEVAVELAAEPPSGEHSQFQAQPSLALDKHDELSEAADDSAMAAARDVIAEQEQDAKEEQSHNVDAVQPVFAAEETIAELEGNADFHQVFDTLAPEFTAPKNTSSPGEQDQATPVNQEAPYEVYAAGIPPEAAAEEPQEIAARAPGAYRDGNNDGTEPSDSFTADNLPDIDELQLSGFSALETGEADEAELSVPAPKAHTQRDKEELREYLAELEDTDALGPLPATTVDALEAEPLTIEVVSSFRRYVSTFAWLSLSLVLVAVFVFQVVANNLQFMQNSPSYSRYLPFFCRVLTCPEPPAATSGIESFNSQDLLVRSHPSVSDALEVSFIFRNDAEVPQAFPLIELSFSDSNKRLIANRLFKPEEYLPPELAVLDLMPARSSVQVMLELADPSSAAVDYEIIFREATQENLNNSTSPARIP